MKNFTRRLSIVLSATAVTIGLMGAAAPAHADDDDEGDSSITRSARDTGWW